MRASTGPGAVNQSAERSPRLWTLHRLVPGPLRRLVGRRLSRLSHAWHYARAAAAEDGSTPLFHLRDARQCHRRYGIGPAAYYYYRFFDPAKPPDEKARYIPDDLYALGGQASRRFQRRLAPRRYHLLFDNKLVSGHFFRSAGLPVPRMYGVYDPVLGHTMDGARLRDSADLRAWVEAFTGEGFVFKPLAGGFGINVLVLTSRALDDRGVFLTAAGRRYDADRLVAATRDPTVREFLRRRNHGCDLDSYLLQEHVRPHPAITALTGGPTLCSVRVQTFVDVAGAPRILGAGFKLQPARTGVDNMAFGTVLCWVEVDRGTLGPGRTLKSVTEITTLPDTSRSFVGFGLPDWPAVQSLALKAAAAFPWARCIGWDIGLSDRGPILLEGNDLWGPGGVQLAAPHGLLTGDFKALYESLEPSNRPRRRTTSPTIRSGRSA